MDTITARPMLLAGALLVGTGFLLAPAMNGTTPAAAMPRPDRHWTPAAATYAQVTDVPSHHARYRASLVFGVATARGAVDAEVHVTTAEGEPVTGAALALERSMPEDDTVRPAAVRAVAELGGGRYRVRGLRFDRTGWWTVRLVIHAASTDSLAFNLIR